jgi:hypothetical protein
MPRQCLIQPENVCSRTSDAADATCVCAPPGMAHDDRCATKRGHKCNCMIAVVGEPSALDLAVFASLVIPKRGS